MLDVRALAARRGDARLFEDLSFQVNAGQALVVTGPNGTGKTTLLRMLAGLSLPFAGEIRLHGVVLSTNTPQLRQQLLYIGHLPALKDELTVEENLTSSVMLAGTMPAVAAVRAALVDVALDAKRALPARALSQGQRRRVGLARLALLPRPLWLLDEPATALDQAALAQLGTLMRHHLATGGAIVAATHQALDLPVSATQSLVLA